MSQVSDAMDLVVLVADKDLEEAMKSLLARAYDLNLGPFRFEVRRHPNRDGGCRTGAANFLRPFSNATNAVWCFSTATDVAADSRARRFRATSMLTFLKTVGRIARRAIVIEPELEAWVWGDLAQLSRSLGWKGRVSDLRRRLDSLGLWEPPLAKPSDPKRAMRAAMESAPSRHRRRRSARIFGEIAELAAVDACRDPAFNELRNTLQTWFPADRC